MKVYIVLDERRVWDGEAEEVNTIIDSVHATKGIAVAKAKAKALLATVLAKHDGSYRDVEYLCPRPSDNWLFRARITWEDRFEDELTDDIYVEEWEVEDNDEIADDAPEIVRCKDCKYWDRTTSVDGDCFCDRLDERRLDDGSFDYFTKENWYCAEGEKEDE